MVFQNDQNRFKELLDFYTNEISEKQKRIKKDKLLKN